MADAAAPVDPRACHTRFYLYFGLRSSGPSPPKRAPPTLRPVAKYECSKLAIEHAYPDNGSLHAATDFRRIFRYFPRQTFHASPVFAPGHPDEFKVAWMTCLWSFSPSCGGVAARVIAPIRLDKRREKGSDLRK